MQNEFLHDYNEWLVTGELPTDNTFMINLVIEKIKISKKTFWEAVRGFYPNVYDEVRALSREALMALEDDLNGFHPMSSHEKLILLGIKTKQGKIIN